MVIKPHNGVLLSNEIKWTADTNNDLDASENRNTEQENSDTNAFSIILFRWTFRKGFLNLGNYNTVLFTWDWECWDTDCKGDKYNF